MASTPKQTNGTSPSNNNRPGGKRKKSRGKGSFLSKWLDKTMHDIQEPSLSSEMYDTFLSSNMYPLSNSQFAPGYDPYKYSTYGCASEPMSLPSIPTYYNPFIPPPYSEYRNVNNEHKGIQVQRPRHRRRNGNKAEEVGSFPADNMNQNSYLELKHFSDGQDFASLPPIVTSMPDTNSNSDRHANDKDTNNGRRFSDPCVRGLPGVESVNGDAESNSDSGSETSESQVGSRLISCLLDQISTLKMANGRLTKELHETRAELDSMRQNSYFPKGPGSMGGTSNFNSNGQYSPGCLSELVREIRDAARMREEAMYARLRSMLAERTDSGLVTAESKLAERTLEEIKSSLRASDADKRLMMDRIMKLEDELRHLRLTGCESEQRLNGGEEDERSRMRREITELRRAKHTAEEHTHKLERLVTQLRSKFNGLQVTNGPDSLQSDHDHDHETRPRRISSSNTTNALSNALSNSSNFSNALSHNLSNLSNALSNSSNSTVVFGPVTDL